MTTNDLASIIAIAIAVTCFALCWWADVHHKRILSEEKGGAPKGTKKNLT